MHKRVYWALDMEQLNDFLQRANYQPVFSLLRAGILLAIGVIVAILLLHTLHIMGQSSPLYRKRKPVEGWTKRVFTAGILLIAVLLVLLWALGRFSHALLGTGLIIFDTSVIIK